MAARGTWSLSIRRKAAKSKTFSGGSAITDHWSPSWQCHKFWLPVSVQRTRKLPSLGNESSGPRLRPGRERDGDTTYQVYGHQRTEVNLINTMKTGSGLEMSTNWSPSYLANNSKRFDNLEIWHNWQQFNSIQSARMPFGRGLGPCSGTQSLWLNSSVRLPTVKQFLVLQAHGVRPTVCLFRKCPTLCLSFIYTLFKQAFHFQTADDNTSHLKRHRRKIFNH